MKVDPNKLQEIQKHLKYGSLFEIQLILDELLNSDEICECENCNKLIDEDVVVYHNYNKRKNVTSIFCSEECKQEFLDSLYDYDGR